MKTPDEIKKALECCFYESAQCRDCPYYPTTCDRELVRDAREYIRQLEAQNAELLETVKWMEAERDDFKRTIRQLEAERAAAVEDLKTAKRCKVCKYDHIKDMDEPCFSCSCCCGVNNFEWRGVQKEG